MTVCAQKGGDGLLVPNQQESFRKLQKQHVTETDGGVEVVTLDGFG